MLFVRAKVEINAAKRKTNQKNAGTVNAMRDHEAIVMLVKHCQAIDM